MTKVTYKMPSEDDSAVVTMGGIRFFDGQATEVEEGALLDKLRGNHHFTVSESKPKVEKEPKPVDQNALKAVHIAGGRFVIRKGTETIKEGLNKADADVFNALNDGDKLAYIED